MEWADTRADVRGATIALCKGDFNKLALSIQLLASMKLTLMVLIKYLCMVFYWLRMLVDYLGLFSSFHGEDGITKCNLGN